MIRSEISTPPATEVRWSAATKKRCIVVKARTWFEARATAMLRLKCGPDDVAVEMAK